MPDTTPYFAYSGPLTPKCGPRSYNHRKCRSYRIRKLYSYAQANHGIIHFRKQGLSYLLSSASSIAPGPTQSRHYFNSYCPSSEETKCPTMTTKPPPSTPTTATVSNSFTREELQSYMNTIDALQHAVTFKFPWRFTQLSNTSPQYQLILLHARTLKASIQSYAPNIEFPLQHPVIYTHEPPIVIDTGASSSITPLEQDFLQRPSVPDSPSIKGH
mmetsp:Transcript_15113/g.42021  ORF Transcript_15113/g.42021 Transcript_15113/m.42021 type:complete len:215 (-) Transcript_15113:1706-2350(-)